MKISREELSKMIAEAMHGAGMMDMMAAMPMDAVAAAPAVGQPGGHRGSVSREDCCAAVMCLVECCSCPVTREKLMALCDDLMAGRHDG